MNEPSSRRHAKLWQRIYDKAPDQANNIDKSAGDCKLKSGATKMIFWRIAVSIFNRNYLMSIRGILVSSGKS